MTMSGGDDTKREIIIVKRRGGDDDHGHHGGVWKIAFADFMTAMMCFFLVMWLVNATTQDTKAAVASYFNPMRLADPLPQPSTPNAQHDGQSHDTVEGTPGWQNENPAGDRTQNAGPAQDGNAPGQHDNDETSDTSLFADPFAVLAEIAQQTATLQNVSARGDGGAQDSGPATGALGGESYRDPFAPDFWSEQVAVPAIQDVEPLAVDDAALPIEDEEAVAEVASVEEIEEVSKAALIAPEPEEANDDIDASTPNDGVEDLAQSLRTDLADAFGAESRLNDTISVTAVDKGVLISLTDDLDYGMFQVGSAVPVGDLVRAMEKVGAALDARPGKVAVMGHTDGRPFRNAEYDNWRLSSARAHSAYYMLVRGGLEEARVAEVSGFADRQLKNAADPYDASNRRIEILLEVDG